MPAETTRRRRTHVAALAAALVATLAGCAGIPTEGPVVTGAPVGANPEDQFIRVIARPPRAGMTPEQVVGGFLEAGASLQEDDEVARAYLTRSAAQSWNPDAGTRVYEGAAAAIAPAAIAPATSGTVRLTAPLVGRISDVGQYDVAAPGTSLAVNFGLVKVDGEWRIDSLPNGLLLTRGDVERGLRTYDVYFLDPTFATLVPDPITVPLVGPGQATVLTRALLRGPTPWLAPAVRTAVPDGTSLAIDSVPVEGGVASVALDPRVLAADDRTRSALSAQLVWTLTGLPDVTSVRITVGGQPLPVPGQGTLQTRDSWASYDPDALPAGATGYLVTRGRAGRLVGDRVEPVPGAAGTGQPALGSIAVSLDSSEIAGVSVDRARLYVGAMTAGRPLVVRATGGDLSTPSYDREGRLWWVDRGVGVRVLRRGGQPVPVTVDGLGKAAVTALAVARDGTRAALVAQRGARSELLLVRVERRGETLVLAAPRRLESRLGDVRDATWSAAGRLVALGAEGAAEPVAFLVDVGHGTVRPFGAPADPRAVAAAPGRVVLAGAGDGRVWQYLSGRWSVAATGSAPAYPG